MDEQLKRIIDTIRERMSNLYNEYTSGRNDCPDRWDYYDGVLDAYWEIDEMLDDVFREVERWQGSTSSSATG